MTCYRTCHTCAKPAATCPTRETLHAALAGLRITSVKHRCADYVAAFLPGEPVKVETFAWYHRDEDDPPPKLWFPGHFVRLAGNRALVFVKSGAEDLNGEEVKFEPNGNGYLKVPLSRVAVANGEHIDVTECNECGSAPGIGEPCRRDPIYGRKSRCLADQRAQSSEAPTPMIDRAEGERSASLPPAELNTNLPHESKSPDHG